MIMFIIRSAVLTVIFLLLFIMTVASVALLSLGLTAIALSLMVMTGLFTNVASELPPLSAFFAGISCLSGGAAMSLAVITLFPKQAGLFKRRGNAK